MNETTPYRRFETSARRRADRIAVRSGAKDLTSAALERCGREVAKGLIALGLAPGERVAIWGVNSAEWVLAGLGLQAARGVLVPIGTRLRGREAAGVLRESEARILFCDSGFGDFDFVAAALAQDLPALTAIVVLDGERGDDGRAAGAPRVLSLPRLRALGETLAEATLDERIRAAAPDDLADIIFTSGTTGRPKGVPMTNAQSLAACDAQQDEIAHFTDDDVFAVAFPFAHNAGYRAGWQVSLLHGVRIVPAPVVEGERLLQLVQRERVTFLPMAPPMAQAMLDHPGQADFDLSSLRSSGIGATTVPKPLLRALRARLGPSVHVMTGYGLTEAAGSVTMTRPQDDDVTIADTVGRPLASLEVRCVDAERRAVAQGEIGEIAVRGVQVMHGYFRNPEATAQSFTSDGFLLTGDAGWFDADGNLRMTDRIKDMYLVGGFNCYPAEIEHMMRAMPGVGEVAVIGIDDERLGQVGRAFVVRAAGATITEAQVIAWCRDEMANYKVPRSVRFVDALPRNATGKVDKVRLRAEG